MESHLADVVLAALCASSVAYCMTMWHVTCCASTTKYDILHVSSVRFVTAVQVDMVWHAAGCASDDQDLCRE